MEVVGGQGKAALLYSGAIRSGEQIDAVRAEQDAWSLNLHPADMGLMQGKALCSLPGSSVYWRISGHTSW